MISQRTARILFSQRTQIGNPRTSSFGAKLHLKRQPLLSKGSGAIDVSTYNSRTKQVSVTVSWREVNAATSTVALTTLVTEIGGLP